MLFIFLFNFYSNAQQSKVPLITILTQLEKTGNYQFTYANDVIDGVFVLPPPISLTFKEKIAFLKKKSGLDFEFIDNTFIAIKRSNKLISICGYVLDKETGMPLEAVAILGSKEQVITDAYGYFKMEALVSEDIEIRYLGFIPINIAANAVSIGVCKNIFLEADIESLSEIVLSNIFASGINKVTDGSLNINFSNFGILPGLIEADVLQTIQTLPGVQSVNETVSDINIRGGTNDQNLILWDGIKMYQTGHFFGLISALNPQITNEATVIKNGTSVDYSDGVSGTIAMKTDKKVNNSFSASIATNFISSDVFADIPTSQNSSLQVAARKAITGFGDTPTYKKYFDRIQQGTEVGNFDNGNASFDFYDTSLRWIYDLSDKDQIKANFIYIDNNLSFLESETVNTVTQSRTSRLEQNTLASGLSYKRAWNDYLTTTLQVSNSEYKLGANNVDVLQANRLTQVNKVEETSTKLNSWLTINDELSLLNGYQFTETAVNNLTGVDNPEFTRFVREVIREHGVYSQLNYTNDRTHIKLGARYNYIKKFNKHIIEPRLSVHYELAEGFSVELLGEFKHQNTMQIINFQNDFFGVEKRRWFLSNNTTRPIIQSKQVSLGLNYARSGWLISADGYFKNVDGINAPTQGFVNQYIFSDAIGSYDVYGIDFLLNKKIDKLSMWLNYSFANNDYTFNSLEEINFPNNLDINHSISFGTSYTMNDFKVSAGLNWRTGIPTTKPIAGNEFSENSINYASANSSNLNEYLRIDASVTYRFNLTNRIKAQAGASVWNASNNNNTISSFYNSDDQGNVSKISKNALELTPNVSFRVLF